MKILFWILYAIVVILYLLFKYGKYNTQEDVDAGKRCEKILFKVILVMMVIYACLYY